MEAHLSQAFTLHRAGRLVEAERLYRAALVEHPHDPEALHHLGLIRHQQGDAAAGVRLIQQAIAHDDTRPRFFFNLATILRTQGRPRQAAIARASGWLRAGHAERARKVLQSLLEAAPADPLVHPSRAAMRWDDGSSASARRSASSAVSRSPWASAAVVNPTHAACREGSRDVALP